MDFGADFDEDLFDSKPRKNNTDLAETIKNYKVKQVYSKNFFNETPNKTDDLANWLKMRGDLAYYEKTYEIALDFYQKSLETSRKSKALCESIFHRELTESLARCLLKLKRFDETNEIVSKLEESASNFEQYTTSLNLHLALLLEQQQQPQQQQNKNSNRDEQSGESKSSTLGLVLAKLILLHPMSTHFWRKLTDYLIESYNIDNNNNEQLYLATAFCMTREFAKFGSSSNKNSIYLNYRADLNNWINERTNLVCARLGCDATSSNLENFLTPIRNSGSPKESSQNEANTADSVSNVADALLTLSERLEKLDKWEDNLKLREAQQLDDLKRFFTLF